MLPKNQYEVDAQLLIEHFSQFKHKSITQHLKESFQFEALGNRNPVTHLLAIEKVTGKLDIDCLLYNRKESVLSKANMPVYKAWLKAMAFIEDLRMQSRIDDQVYTVGQCQSLNTGNVKSNIKIDRDDLPSSDLTVQGTSDWTGTSYKNIRQGSYMGKKSR